LRSIERTGFVAVSGFYRTAPIDAPGPDFLNAVARVDTELEPYSLLLHLLDIEMMLGRKRRAATGQKNAPRKVDLDLLLVGDLIIRSTPLTLPHPRLHERAFVLRPLLDLEPQLLLPGLGQAADLLARITDQRIEPVDIPPIKPQ
jgi:2-amino-4-hydroxy-6-hydroxymethyldihydropteridine diphosphokinase